MQLHFLFTMTMKETKRAKRVAPRPEQLHQSQLLIDLLGGTTEVSRLCEVSSAAVSQWRRSGIPQSRLLFLREHMKVRELMGQSRVSSEPERK